MGFALCNAMDSWTLGLSAVIIIAAVFYTKQFILHPFARYPGPFLARCTTLYAAYYGWRGSIHTDMYRCHQKYGPVVRYGPNRLLIDTHNAVKEIYAHNSNNTKSKSYKALIHGAPNTFTIRRKEDHSWRRRILALALSDSRILHYESTLRRHIDALCANLQKNAESKSETPEHQPLDMSQQCDYFSFDTMADAIFGVRYSSLTEPTYRFVNKALGDSNIRMSALFQASILKVARLDKYLFPLSIQGRNNFLGFISSLLKNRALLLGDGSIFSFLEAARDPSEGQGLSKSQVRAECASLVIAGSDTTSTTLAATLFYLSKNPNAYEKVRDEVRSKFCGRDEIVVGSLLKSCVYLRACIDEALRMSPPAGSALWREVGPGGMVVDSLAIPAGADVGVSIYSIHHNDKYYKEPFKYRPERWLAGEGFSDKEAVEASRSAFMPFSRGIRSCVGKGFAYHQLTLALAHVIHQMDFTHADDKTYSSWSRNWGIEQDEYLLEDHITGTKNGPFLRFELRERANS